MRNAGAGCWSRPELLASARGRCRAAAREGDGGRGGAGEVPPRGGCCGGAARTLPQVPRGAWARGSALAAGLRGGPTGFLVPQSRVLPGLAGATSRTFPQPSGCVSFFCVLVLGETNGYPRMNTDE